MSESRREPETIEDLREHCRRLESLLQTARESDRWLLRQIIDINPHFIFAKNREGRFTLVNQAVADAYGTSVEELIGKSDADFNSNAEEVEHFRKDDLEVMDTLREMLIPEEIITDSSGKTRWLQTIKRPIVGLDGRADQVLGVAIDITRHKALEQQLSHAALHDSLTGLPNRALFNDRLAMALESAGRSPHSRFAVLLIDLDRFKLVNDGLGHLAGDQLLVEAASRFPGCVRPGDTVARLGGDEFTILLTETTGLREAIYVAERIRTVLSEPLNVDGREVYISASIGIVLHADCYQDSHEILRDADTALYRAKATARGSHVVFDPAMHARAVAELELENDLWRAVERRELRLAFQPIVQVADGRIVEHEALLRWQHPRRGLLDPGDFLPLAAETSLLLRIEEWLIGEACRLAASWPRPAHRPPWGLSLNLSATLFNLGDPVRRVLHALQTTGFEPELLRIEITETALMDRLDAVARNLAELRSRGVRVDIDDFGTGYSSLSYLHRLPVDRLKIDRSFVQRLDQGGDGYAIAHTIVTLARELKLEAMAEGVENEAQLERVRELACSHAQGYYFSRPLETCELEKLPLRLPGA